MAWDELLIWALILGFLIAVAWLIVAVTRRLWAWLASWRRPQRRPTRLPRTPLVELGPPRRVRVDASGAQSARTRVELGPARDLEMNRQSLQSTPFGVASRDPAPRTVVLGPARRVKLDTRALFGGTPVRRGAPLVVSRHHHPLWVEKGWQRNGRGYTGYYRAGGRRWRGLIEEPYPGGYKAYIWNPPLRELDGHPHRPCFRRNGRGGRYEVHFHSMPASLDHAITTIEAVLAEAMGTRS